MRSRTRLRKQSHTFNTSSHLNQLHLPCNTNCVFCLLTVKWWLKEYLKQLHSCKTKAAWYSFIFFITIFLKRGWCYPSDFSHTSGMGFCEELGQRWINLQRNGELVFPTGLWHNYRKLGENDCSSVQRGKHNLISDVYVQITSKDVKE